MESCRGDLYTFCLSEFSWVGPHHDDGKHVEHEDGAVRFCNPLCASTLECIVVCSALAMLAFVLNNKDTDVCIAW